LPGVQCSKWWWRSW